MSSSNVITVGSSLFDPFRDDGGPVLYSSMNRTPAVEDIRNILIYISFSTLFVAFLIIFPGIRKERFSTFICVTISLFMGAVILLSNCGSNWHVAQASIASPYRAFSREKIFANVGVHIGLDSVNITLKALPIHPRYEDIKYNERFYWIGPSQMKQEFQRALAKGLPYPILTIAEYLSQDIEGFNWGRSYRLAGYYTGITLWLAFACWVLMNILLCAVPRYGAYMMQVTGALMLLSNLLYVGLIPAKPLRIPFEGATLNFHLSYCFWMVFSAGITAVVIGLTVSLVDIYFPNKFSTILEVDYDTPYRYFVGNDAHIIGSLPPPLSSYYSYHQTQSSLSTASHLSSNHHLYQKKKSLNVRHYSASKTASIATDSTCCAGSTAHMSHRVVSKTKSDASTCTRDEIDLDLSDISPQSETPSLSVPKNMSTTFVTTVEIENTHKRMIANQNLDEADKDNNNHMHLVPDSLTFELTKLGGDGGIENAAYQVDDGDEQLELELESKFEESSANVETPPSKEPKGEVSPNSPISSSPATSGATSEDDGNMSDVSTTIIDGKRAISLSNFGKFAAAQQKKDGIQGRMVGPTFGYQMASAGLRPKATAFPKRIQQGRDKPKSANETSTSSLSTSASKSPSASKIDLSSPSAMW